MTLPEELLWYSGIIDEHVKSDVHPSTFVCPSCCHVCHFLHTFVEHYNVSMGVAVINTGFFELLNERITSKLSSFSRVQKGHPIYVWCFLSCSYLHCQKV